MTTNVGPNNVEGMAESLFSRLLPWLDPVRLLIPYLPGSNLVSPDRWAMDWDGDGSDDPWMTLLVVMATVCSTLLALPYLARLRHLQPRPWTRWFRAPRVLLLVVSPNSFSSEPVDSLTDSPSQTDAYTSPPKGCLSPPSSDTTVSVSYTSSRHRSPFGKRPHRGSPSTDD